MEFMGHADLQMVNRYVKLLPHPGETVDPGLAILAVDDQRSAR